MLFHEPCEISVTHLCYAKSELGGNKQEKSLF